jgi:hypothetical protein
MNYDHVLAFQRVACVEKVNLMFKTSKSCFLFTLSTFETDLKLSQTPQFSFELKCIARTLKIELNSLMKEKVCNFKPSKNDLGPAALLLKS